MIKNIPDLRLQKIGKSDWNIIYLNGNHLVGRVRKLPTRWLLNFHNDIFYFSTRTEALEHVSDALDPAASSL
jgi:hypothetical protein